MQAKTRPGLQYKHTTTMLQRGIYNSHRHGIELKVGILNATECDCAYQTIKANIANRICLINKVNESANQCRIRCITKAQNEAHLIPCIRKDTAISEWNKLKQPGIYDTELADTAIIAISRGINKDILIFNTDHNISHTSIYVIRAEEYPGGKRDNPNPVILSYNGSHCESLDTCTKEDDIKAINLLESVKKGKYNLIQSDIQQMSRITRIKRDINITKEKTSNAKCFGMCETQVCRLGQK